MSNEQNQLLCLIKFGTLDRLKELHRTGRLYMSSVDELRKEEKNKDDNTGRYDEFECTVNVVKMDGGTIKMEHPDVEDVTLPVQSGFLHEYITGNLSCFFGVSSEHFEDGTWKVNIDKRMLEFGEYVLFIHDKTTLIKLMEAQVLKTGMDGLHGFAKYDTEEIPKEGKRSVLQKRKKYSYQNEYRYFLNSGKADAHILELGSLDKISAVWSVKTLMETTFSISQRELNFKVSPTQKKSEVWDFIATDKRLQLKADFNPFKGLVLHLGTINGFSKQIPLYENKLHLDEDVSWCKNVWVECESVDKEYTITVLLS